MQEPTQFELKKSTRNKLPLLSWYHHVVLILLGLTILSYCSPIRISFPIRGKIVDSETRQPVEGAVVRLSREAICARMIHGSDHYEMPTLEARTDSDGNFRISGIWGAAPCLSPSWLYMLTMVAKGYIPVLTDNERDHRLSGPFVFGTYEIRPIRFKVEMLDLYEPYLAFGEMRQHGASESKQSLFAKTINSAKAAAVRHITLAGVFASITDSSFDFVTVHANLAPDIQQGTIIARDKSRHRFYGWDPFGNEISLYESEAKERHTLKPKSSYVLKLSENSIAAKAPTKCESKEGFGVTIPGDNGKRSLLVFPPVNSGWKLDSQSVDLPQEMHVTEISGCSGTVNSVYVALKNQGIFKIEFVRAGYATFNARVAAFVSFKDLNGPLNFVSIALATIDWQHLRPEVIYAVAGDNNIYRFSSRLVPDRRIQVVK